MSQSERDYLREHYGLIDVLGEPSQTSQRPPSIPIKMLRLARVGLTPAATIFAPDPQMSASLQAITDQEKYDVVVGRYLESLTLTNCFRSAPTLLDVDDVPWDYWRTRAESAGNFLLRKLFERQYERTRRAAEFQLKRCNFLWFANPIDARGESSGILPNVPFHEPVILPPALETKRLLIVGTLSHPPNRAGIDEFIRTAWPVVHAEVPDAELHIVGGGLSDALRRRWSTAKGVVVHGFVPDLTDVYARASFTVAPIQFGAGTNIKLMEAFAFGRTAVATTFATRGFEQYLLSGQSILTAHSIPQMATPCIQLLKKPSLQTSLAENGAKVINRYFSRAVFHAEVTTQVSSFINSSSDAVTE